MEDNESVSKPESTETSSTETSEMLPPKPPTAGSQTLDPRFNRPPITWQPAPAKPDREPIVFHRRWIVAVLAVGLVCAFSLPKTPWSNIGGAAIILSMGIGLLVSGWLQTRTSQVLAAVAMTFGVLLTLSLIHI